MKPTTKCKYCGGEGELKKNLYSPPRRRWWVECKGERWCGCLVTGRTQEEVIGRWDGEEKEDDRD